MVLVSNIRVQCFNRPGSKRSRLVRGRDGEGGSAVRLGRLHERTRGSVFERRPCNERTMRSRALDLDSGGGDGKDGVGGGGSGNGWGPGDGDSDERPSSFNPIALFLAGVKARTTADPNFPFKICMELFNDASIIFAVNFIARGDRFWKEIQFVLCQAAVSLMNDTALVYLLAPTGEQVAKRAAGFFGYLSSLPANVFQAGSFSISQRMACILYKGCIYSCIGLVMGLIGTQVVHSLTDLQEQMDPGFVPPAEMQPVLKSGFAWMGFMGISSNLRYQAVNGLERLLYSVIGNRLSFARVGSLLIRLSNNFLGSMTWIWWAGFLKLNEPRLSKKKNA